MSAEYIQGTEYVPNKASQPDTLKKKRMVLAFAIFYATIAAIAYYTGQQTIAIIFGVMTVGQVGWYAVNR